jgi:hypothetical protein
MAVLYITEYARIGMDPSGVTPVPIEPELAKQTLVIGTVVTSNVFQPATKLVRLHTDVVCSIEFGFCPNGVPGGPAGSGGPVATATSARMAANQTEYHGVPQGGNFAVSCITNS